jgi:transcriptional regulator with XRE-family HTH domain
MSLLPTVDSQVLGARLAASLQEKGWSYKEFQKKVQRAAGGARGTSYGTIWSYVNGEVAEPKPRVVRAMADALGLSTHWLVSGRGPRTQKEVVRESLHEDLRNETTARLGSLLRAMETARSRLPPLERQLLERRDHVLENLVVDLLESGGRGLETYGEGEVAEAFALTAWMMALPLRMLGPDAAAGSRGVGEEYVLAMAATIRLAMPASPEGQPFGVLARLRRLRTALAGDRTASASPPPADGIGGAAH